MKFLWLAKQNNLIESNSQQVATYLNGLRPIILDKIGVQMLVNVSEAQNMVLNIELMMWDKKTDFIKK